MGALEGDANGDGFVNFRRRTANTQPLGRRRMPRSSAVPTVNADGFVNSGDTVIVRARSGNALP